MNTPRQQQGVVVIVALLIVALAATAATLMVQQQDFSARQLEAARDYEQARWVLNGGTHWARAILAEDARSNRVDHERELWATGLPPTDFEQGRISGAIRDQQGLFNLNNLARDGKSSERDVAALKRMLRTLALRADLAEAIADWIDADSIRNPGGAEDADYLRLPAPYLAANRAMTDLNDLRRVRGVDEAALAKLRLFATVLPRRTPVNVNLAPPEVLSAVVDGLTLPEARVLVSSRSAAPFRDRDDFRSRLPRRDLLVSDEEIAVESQFFLVEGRAQVGKADLRASTLLQRGGNTLPSIVWQRLS
ncbi:MAG: type II secretion system minor pseudopilin GspK [Candidatus Parcubacteria bacterium]|nr:type II secretion system minor pseudopilin GspK [Burkholderiales bacterium]